MTYISLVTTILLSMAVSTSSFGASVARVPSIGTSTCSMELLKTEKLIINSDGTPDYEDEFLTASEKTLAQCTEDAQSNSMKAFALLGKENCDKASEQGMSKFFKALCLMKISEAINFIIVL